MKNQHAARGQWQKMRFVSTVVCVMVMLTIVGINSVFASTMLFDRGLPTANLNDAAGSLRSNVAWAFDDPSWAYGDDFNINGSGEYRVDTLRVWVVGGLLGEPNLYANTTFTLWGGGYDFTTALSTSGVMTQVTYANGSSYQNGGNFNIYQLEFTDLNWLIYGNSDGNGYYNFGVSGKDSAGAFQQVRMHASNAALGGLPAEGADGWLLSFSADGTYGGYPDPYYQLDSYYYGWDKSSDLNVQIEGAPVPEPSTMLLLATGLFGFVTLRKRARK